MLYYSPHSCCILNTAKFTNPSSCMCFLFLLSECKRLKGCTHRKSSKTLINTFKFSTGKTWQLFRMFLTSIFNFKSRSFPGFMSGYHRVGCQESARCRHRLQAVVIFTGGIAGKTHFPHRYLLEMIIFFSLLQLRSLFVSVSGSGRFLKKQASTQGQNGRTDHTECECAD